MPATKTRSDHASAAQMIRTNLKKAFPGVKFSVRSRAFSMGDDVRVSWTDGPTDDEVEAIANAHEAGTFDGMTDMYTYDKINRELPQVKYVLCQRGYSRETYTAAVDFLNRRYGWDLEVDQTAAYNTVTPEGDAPMSNNYGYRSHRIYQLLQATSCMCAHCKAATLPGDKFCPECGTATPDLPGYI